MASPPLRSSQYERSSTSRSSSSIGSDWSTPSYVVEENSEGELVNKRMGVTWPARVHNLKKYPHDTSPSVSSLASTECDDQFATSSYEMICLADLEAGCTRSSFTFDTSYAASPKYLSLSSSTCSSDESTNYDTDETSPIDSIVFNTAEELERYERIFRNQVHKTPSSTSTTSMGEDVARHFIGVRSRRAVDAKLTPGHFFVYYDKPSGAIPVAVDLKIGYMSSSKKIYHFPIQKFVCEGEPYYVVMQTHISVKMFPSISSLVQYYHEFSNDDPVFGLEPFGVPI